MEMRSKIMEIVTTALTNLNKELPLDSQVSIGPNTKLFGVDAELDSLSLVSLIVDVELGASDYFGQDISLTDDKAMSRAVSPFKSVETLTEYIMEIAPSD